MLHPLSFLELYSLKWKGKSRNNDRKQTTSFDMSRKHFISCFHIINHSNQYIYIYMNWFNLFISNSSISSCSLWHSKSYKIDSLCKKSCSENSRNFSHRRISYKNEEDHLDTSLWQSDQLHWQDLPWCFYFFGPKNLGRKKKPASLAMQVEGTFDFYAHQRGVKYTKKQLGSVMTPLTRNSSTKLTT